MTLLFLIRYSLTQYDNLFLILSKRKPDSKTLSGFSIFRLLFLLRRGNFTFQKIEQFQRF